MGSRARCGSCVIQPTLATAGRLVATGTGCSNTGTDSCCSRGRTSRNQPMHPLTAKIAPKMLTAAVVTIPANTNATPRAKTIGHAVGDGSSTVFGPSSCVFIGTSTFVVIYHSTPDDVNHREHHHPHRVYKMPIERQYIEAIGMLVPHVSPKQKSQNGREKNQTYCHVEGM